MQFGTLERPSYNKRGNEDNRHLIMALIWAFLLLMRNEMQMQRSMVKKEKFIIIEKFSRKNKCLMLV